MVKTGLKCAGASDAGLLRQNNEDSFFLDPERGIFLVVDGIGGQAAGERAAEIAVDRIRARLERQTGTTEQRIREAIAMANNEILRAAREHPEWRGMACVLTLVVLENGSAVYGHVGDSRLYQMRRGEIRKVTRDHSPVGQREDANEIDEFEAMRHPRRNEVFRDVGSEEHAPGDAAFIDAGRIDFDPESAFLLCSDGLSDQVPSGGILAIVERHAGDPEAAVHALIEVANRAGGKDNVTVLLAEGEAFAAAHAPEERTSGNFLASRPALFCYGALLAAAITWYVALQRLHPVVIEHAPGVFEVGANGFSTIAQALAAARPGDTVEVAAGEYREAVHLKAGVTLRSRVPREAVLRAAPLAAGPAIAAENLKGASLAGFRIAGDKDAPVPIGILLIDAAVEVDDVEVDGAGVGIEIRGSASPTLLGNAIHDCAAEGILITGASEPWISHNSLERNKGAALRARDGARPSLVGNVFDGNTIDLPPGIPMDGVREHNFFIETRKPKR